MRKILKLLFYTLVLIALAAAVACLVVIREWPWWVGVALGAGLLSVWFGILFLKKYMLRSRERRFIRQVIAQDQASIEEAPFHERRQLKELQEKWKASVDLLRSSNLKKHGNPLYVLPWYMVLGESGTGKTTAIKNAKANSPVSDISRSAGISGTRNFDWWFFEEAIILDTAGRYSIPIDEEPDREEWEEFLTLVARYRKKEPLNGVVLAVSADRLLLKSGDELRENGLNMRKRIDELMRICGARFPVYIMVTKTDLVHGFTPFSQLLPEDRLNQAMGYSNENLADNWKAFVDSAHRFVGDRLKDLRLLILQKTTRVDPGVLLFPDEFEKLYSGLNAFAKGAFEENPYQETPMLMGIYYSSGRQEGQPCSEFIEKFNIAYTAPANPRNGIFLADFFKKILPGDRNLFLPILEFFKWRRTTKRFGLAAWCLLWVCVLGLISFAYTKNRDVAAEISRTAEFRPAFTSNMSTDLLMLSAYGQRLDKIRQLNRNWPVPRFGLDHSLQVEQRFVDDYLESFREHFLEPMDRQLEKNIREFGEDTPDETIADYAGHIVARMTLLKLYLEGGKPKTEERLADISSEVLLVVDPQLLNEIALQFGRNYYSYLEMIDDRQAMEDNLDRLHTCLVDLLEVRDMRLDWLLSKKMPDISSFELGRYWGQLKDRDRMAHYPAVPAVYTVEGRSRISSFIERIEDVLGRSVRFNNARRFFWQRYDNLYLQAWANFAVNFSEGRDFLTSYEQWKTMAKSMATEENPYFKLLSHMAGQLQVIENPPAWAAMIMEMEDIRTLRPILHKGDPSLVDRIRSKGTDAVQKTLTVTSPEAAKEREEMLHTAETWNGYVNALSSLASVGHTPKMAYQMAREFFNQEDLSSNSDSPFFKAHDQLFLLNSRLEKTGDLSVAGELVRGPLDFLAHFATREAAAVIQQEWEAMVLADSRGIDPQKVPYVIFKRPGGAVWKFLEGPAAPFVGRGRDGFYSTTSLGQSIPFPNAFFMFLNQGAEGTVDVQPTYSVKLNALPIQVNEGAAVRPYATFLNLSCADGQIQLKNYNFRASQQFDWTMNRCGDVELSILMPDARLNYYYRGDLGFARFLEDFRGGARVFTPEDFPEQFDLLKNWGISRIRVSYELKDAGPVIALLKDVPHELPVRIVRSW